MLAKITSKIWGINEWVKEWKEIENAKFSEKNFSTDPPAQLHIWYIFIHVGRNILISFGNYEQLAICEKKEEDCSRLQVLGIQFENNSRNLWSPSNGLCGQWWKESLNLLWRRTLSTACPTVLWFRDPEGNHLVWVMNILEYIPNSRLDTRDSKILSLESWLLNLPDGVDVWLSISVPDQKSSPCIVSHIPLWHKCTGIVISHADFCCWLTLLFLIVILSTGHFGDRLLLRK